MEEEKYVTVCPKCKSTDVDMDKTDSLQFITGLPSMYVCNECGFRGYSFPEVKSSKIKDFKEETKEN